MQTYEQPLSINEYKIEENQGERREGRQRHTNDH